jgi:hypothetical protein
MVVYGLSGGFSWVGLQPSPCYPGCFCERFQAGSIIQPSSSYSNLWYILVGVSMIAFTRIPLPGDKSQTNIFRCNPSYSIVFGIVTIAVGLTSFFYHVTLTLLGRWVDYMGMYAFASFLLVYNLKRLRVVRGAAFAIVYATINISLAIPMIAIPSLVVKRVLFIGVLVLFLVLEGITFFVRQPKSIRTGYLMTALAILAAATAVNLLDERGTMCNHASLWQWHAVWHFLTAVAMGIIYLYFRSEDDGTGVIAQT